MGINRDVDKLVEDLMFVKSAITRSNNILKYIDVSSGLAAVGLWSGIVITGLAGITYMLVNQFGTFAAVPAGYRTALYAIIALFVLITGAAKLLMIMRHARKLNRNITVDKLLAEVYTTQMLNVLIPYLTTIAVAMVFLATRGLGIYIVPTLSVLVGLLCLSYVNVFYLRELIVTGDWFIATGLITLFAAPSLHPLVVLIITFGLGFPTLYAANKLVGK